MVTHYYDQPHACVVRLDEGALRAGDMVHIRGHTTDHYQQVDRLEWEHQLLEAAGPGQDVAMHVSQRVREGDVVYKLTS